MAESSAAILKRLREHVAYCRRCRPERGCYCDYIRPDAERFYELRADEVATARLARKALLR
jgi:hypothetical protein